MFIRLFDFVRRFVLVPLLALGFGAPMQAQDIPGQNAPEFKAALELWLTDEEATALPALSEMAYDGNIAARLLVGLIDKNTSLQGPWLALLPKKERIALLRTTGGLSGTSWLRKVGDVPSVALWLNILDSQADIETALQLADLGEARLVRAGLIALAARQMTGFAAYVDDPRFPDEMRYLIWREWQKSGHNMQILRALASLSPGDPQRGLLQENVSTADLDNWLLATDLAGPLRALCNNHCPNSEGACLRAGLDTLGGYRRFATQGTPLASLISPARFDTSQRGQQGVLRRALVYAFLTAGRLKLIRAIDMCFAGLLEDEGQNF